MLFRKKRKNQNNQKAQAIRDVISAGTENLQDILAPSSIAREPGSLLLGTIYNSGLFISRYPRLVRLGWLSRLLRHPGNIDIALHITPKDPREAIEMLTNKLAQFGATLQEQAMGNRVSDIAFEAALEDAEVLRRKLQFNEESLFDLGVYINIFDEDPEALMQLLKQVEVILGSSDADVRRATFRQQESFDTILPIGQDLVGQVRNFTTSALATTFPFVSPQVFSTDGMPVFLGLTEDKSIVMFDIFSLPSFNSCIIARTGAGKSYLAKLLALRHCYMGVDVVIIDPKGEYHDLARAVNGQVVKISINSDDHINIFDIDAAEGVSDILSPKILTIMRFISMMVGKDITPTERNLLLRLIEKCYRDRGITGDPESIYEDEAVTRRDDRVLLKPERRKKTMPTLGDLYNLLISEGGETGAKLAEALDPYCNGIYARVFNVQTNVDLTSRFIVFDISDMEDELGPYSTFVTMEWLWTQIKRNPKKRLIFIDEAWRLLLRQEEAAEYMAMIARTARQFWGGICVITQQPQDVLDSEHGRAIISNAEVRVMLRQDRNNLNALQEILNLSEEEKSFLAECQRGQAILIAGNNHVAIHEIKGFPHEHPLITTDPEELARLRSVKHDQGATDDVYERREL